ncbi:MAG: flippase-like domain-containing protein [Desulfobacteraceae bacterium]|nr:flippase-like domain-containing protein [Desulfobacteraceae bacterium]
MDIKHWVEKYWFFFFIIFFFVLAFIYKISVKDFLKTVALLELWQLFIIILIYLMISASFIIARKYLLYSLSYTPKIKDLVLIHFSSMAAHYSTPAKLGFLTSIYLLKRFHNIPYATGTAMIFIELTVSTGLCGIIALFGSVYYITNSMKALILSFFILSMLMITVIYYSGSILKKLPMNSRIRKFVKDINDAFSHMRAMHLIVYLLILFSGRILASVNLVLMCFFFSSKLSIYHALIASSAAFFFGAISMVPMGLGIREASLIYYLSVVGVTNEIGLLVATIERLLFTGISVVLGILSSAMLGIKNIEIGSVRK